MNYTAKEVAELLKDKPHQAHYIEFLVKKAIHHSVESKHFEAMNKCKAIEEFCEMYGDELTCDMTFGELQTVSAMYKHQVLKDS